MENRPQNGSKSTSRATPFWHHSFTLRAYPPTCLYVPAEFAPPPNFRDALSSLLQGAENGRDERRLRAVRRAARALRARTGGRALRAPLWGGGPVGPFGVIPKPFRMEAISNGELLRKEAHSEMKTVAEEIYPKANGQKLERNL